ncbi:MAG: ATP-binding cassette protein, partial [Rhizobacter sp.]|nr:ATP-binding cassette protein [Rhizobacter sp.]
MIELEGAKVVFHRGTVDEKIALDGLDLAIADGSFTLVIGTNGAGKSSLLNVLSGSVASDAGRLAIDGVDVTTWPVHRRAGLVARVVQDPMLGTAPTLTVEENMALAAMRGRSRGLGLALGGSRRTEFASRLASFGLGLETR